MKISKDGKTIILTRDDLYRSKILTAQIDDIRLHDFRGHAFRLVAIANTVIYVEGPMLKVLKCRWGEESVVEKLLKSEQERDFKTVLYEIKNGEYVTSLEKIHHGDSILGFNIVAIVEGVLCPVSTCVWCDELRTRCKSRRVA